jgi:hypothetical protein
MARGVLIAAAIATVLLAGIVRAQDAQKGASAGAQAPAAPDTSSQVKEPQGATDTAVHNMIGAWEFSNADHDKICHFNFRADPAPNGYKLDIDRNCPSLFPSTKNMVAWSVDKYGSLRLLDATGNSIVDLSEVENGMYDGFTPEEGRYILQTAAAAPERSAADIAGDWMVTRGAGKPICVLTLANSPLVGDILTLRIKPGCDTLVTRFDPTGWRMDEGELMLMSPTGQTWQFEENDANTWQRVPESSDPVLLVRQ